MRAVSIIQGSRKGSGVNVTPMIDVVMCLIVFYLMVGQLAIEKRAQISIPETTTGIDPNDTVDPIVIGIGEDGTIHLDNDTIDPARLKGELQGLVSRSPGAPVRVRADERAGFGDVRPVLDTLEAIGVTSVEFVTLKPMGGG